MHKKFNFKKLARPRRMRQSDEVRIREQASIHFQAVPVEDEILVDTSLEIVEKTIEDKETPRTKIGFEKRGKRKKSAFAVKKTTKAADVLTSELEPTEVEEKKIKLTMRERETKSASDFTETNATTLRLFPRSAAERMDPLEQKVERIREILRMNPEVTSFPSHHALFDFCKIILQAKNDALFLSLIYPGSPVINLRDPYNNTIFNVACEMLDVNHKLLDNLLTYGENINAQRPDGVTALHLAFFQELSQFEFLKFSMSERNVCPHFEFFRNTRFLVGKGANIDVPDQEDNTPFHYALRSGYLEAVEAFLNERIPAEVENRCLSVIKCILRQKSHYYFALHCCLMLLDLAMANQNCISFRYILNTTQIDLAECGPSILYHLGYAGEPQYINILIEKGVDPNVRTKTGKFPIFAAIKKSSVENVRCFLDSGTWANSSFLSLTTLHLAVVKQSPVIVRMLLMEGADVNASIGYESFMFTCATFGVDQNIVSPTIFDGDYFRMKDNKQAQTPLSFACRLGNFEIVKILLSYGANIYMGNNTILHYAILGKNPAIVNIFLEKGLSINSRSDVYGTPLEFAVSYLGNLPHELNILSLLAAHTAQIIESKKFISKENRALRDKDDRFNQICTTYQEEFKRMKESMISQKFNFSVFDILTKDIDTLGSVLEQEDILRALCEEKYKQEFVSYSKQLEDRIREAKHRRILVQATGCCFQKYLNKNLAFEIVLMIFQYLSIKDLLALFKTTL